MKATYNYDEIYGTLLSKSKDSSERTYFVIECEYWSFYRWMYSHGWIKLKSKLVERNGLKGYEIIFNRKLGD